MDFEYQEEHGAYRRNSNRGTNPFILFVPLSLRPRVHISFHLLLLRSCFFAFQAWAAKGGLQACCAVCALEEGYWDEAIEEGRDGLGDEGWEAKEDSREDERRVDVCVDA